MSVFRHPEKPAYVPPRPIEQLTPDAQRLRDLVPYDGAQISIQVHIDQTGHVVAAHVSKVDSKLNSSLVDASVTAASAWLFEPATLNGKAVSAEHTIVFNYRAAPR